MRINCKINSDIDTLNKYNSIYPWIPNEWQIRPTPINILMKERLLTIIDEQYNSYNDYILINVFNQKFSMENKKVSVIKSNINLNKFQVNLFKYNLHPKTFHYVMWYTYDRNELNDEKITLDIKNAIYNIILTDNFNFVWYENPKMSSPDIYHVQVFWIKLKN